MALTFEWDEVKASANMRKHGVGFEEAATAFGDVLSVTVADPDHSLDEERFILLGLTERSRLLVIAQTVRGDAVRLISARLATAKERRGMKKEPDTRRIDELREEYDFSGGVRGKYAARYGEGANIVILDPDIAKVFRDSKSVNEALRALVEVANRAAAAG